MDRPQGKPIIRHDTPPTPEDPAPSHQAIEEYPDGRRLIRTGNPDEKVLAEYREAIGRHSADAGLRYYYATSLRYSGDRDGALTELERAVKLQQRAVGSHVGSPQLLRQLEELVVSG